MESDNKQSIELSKNAPNPVSFFDTNDAFVLAYTKTEKLASAVYMVTSLFDRDEPMRWSLRKKSGELLSFILTYKDTQEGSLGEYSDQAKTKVLELISLLEISRRGGLVSQMNFSILKQEYFNLISIISNTVSGHSNISDEKHFKEFFTPDKNLTSSHKGHHEIHYGVDESRPVSSAVVSLSANRDNVLDGSEEDNLRKTNRQNMILSLMKKRKELTIKDIASVIKDCSEKTIQRELNSFIAKGVLKRTGVRRWSKYSLA